MRPESSRLLAFFLLIGSVGALSWFAIWYVLTPELGEENAHALASFVALLLFPMVVMARSGRPVFTGRLDRTILPGILIYLPFGADILFSYPAHAELHKILSRDEFLLFSLQAFPVVAAADYLTRRVVQEEATVAWGTTWGPVAGFIAWIVGHAYEFIWLQAYLGFPGSVLFITVSGAVTTLVYARWRNVIGLMLGHWTMNVLVAFVTTRWGIAATGG